MTDASGDIALHKALQSQHLDVVKLLVTEGSEFEFSPNHAQETPLYLASESDFHGALINILISCKKPNYVAGPSNRTPLHAAVIQEHKDCIRSLWRWNKPLCEELDLWGWNSLNVKLGLQDVVSAMLGWKISLVYLPTGSENDWTTAIHIAASEVYSFSRGMPRGLLYLFTEECSDVSYTQRRFVMKLPGHQFKVVGLWHFDWFSILHQVTENVMANKDTEFVVNNQIRSSGNENLGANEEIQKLRQQMIEMHRAWANGLPLPPVPTDNLEYLSSLPLMSYAQFPIFVDMPQYASGSTPGQQYPTTSNVHFLTPQSKTTTYAAPLVVHAFAAVPPPEAPTYDVHPQVVPPYTTRDPALNITGDQCYIFELTFKLTGFYGDTHPPEFTPNTEKPIMIEE
ncbi:putative ankyrin repeat-containing protein-like [Capsicum annuum]|nr:putative ankyrin repeat-containing protein-like [Capsicum annuum]